MSGRRGFLKAVAAAPFAFAGRLSAEQQPQLFLPYVQRVDEDRAVLLWSTTEQGTGQIEWACGGSDWKTVPAATQEFTSSETGLGFSFYQHRAELEQLPAGSTIAYRIRWNSTLRPGAYYSFRTANKLKTLDRFIAFGDSGANTPEQMALMRLMETEDASLVLHTGDLAYPASTYDALQERYLAPYAGLMARAPFFPCPGNHDYGFEGAKAYLSTHSLPSHPDVRDSDKGRYYSFRWGPVRFISLDSNDPLLAEKSSNPMLRWFESELTRNRDFWRVVMFHHPPYTEGCHKDDILVKMARERLAPILEANGVPLVLSGHEHFYQRSYPVRNGQVADGGGGTVYITTGGGGAHLYPAVSTPLHAVGYSAHHYIRVRLEGYTMVVQAIAVNGTELDRIYISPRPAIHEKSPVNAANFRSGIAPGSLVSLFGEHFVLKDERPQGFPVPLHASEVTVTMDGQPLPILYASPTQINFHLPFDCEREVTLKVTTPNGSCQTTAKVEDTAPAFFFVRTETALRPAIFRADNGQTIDAANPATRGQMVSAYLTGLGRVNASLRLGEPSVDREGPRVLAPVTIQLNDLTIQPEYAGLAEGMLGVYRVSFRIPGDIPSGDLSLRIVAGAAASPVHILPAA